MKITTRQEMVQFINDRMNKTYQELSESQRLEIESSLVKTYLVEAHILGDVTHDQLIEFIKAIISQDCLGPKTSVTIKETQEERFFIIQATMSEETVTLYVDTSDSRFWRIHSMNKSNNVDRLMNNLIIHCPDLDRVWMPIQLLLEAIELGSIRGLGLDYDRREIPDIDFESETASVEYFKMQLWGNKARKALKILRDKEAFQHETTLSKVKIKFWLDSQNNSEFSLDDIKYNGKVTARGTSFQSHITLISHLYRKYIDKVTTLEKQYAISYEKENGGYHISGAPINIIFPRPINDLDIFCDSVFSSAMPFRLWGAPIELNEGYARISGFDLHVGRRIDFEVTPNFMRVYLSSNSCGNSVIRLFTNLQHYYDSLVTAQNGKGEAVFEFQSDIA
jgi:hypothetical protein